MGEIVVADASGLIGLSHLVQAGELRGLFDKVTKRLEVGQLRFPREVVEELHVVARNDFLSGWASGLGSARDSWTADIAHQRQVMSLVSAVGFDEGFETLDDKDPAISFVARMCFDLDARGIDFCVLTTDLGSVPLLPTMEQLCLEAGWTIRTPSECAKQLVLLP